MGSIGERLRAERERLRLNQSDFAEAAGTTRKSQFNYETDERRPDADYLAAAAGLGVDVLFVLTGVRDGANPGLDAAERVLLDSYRRCTEQARQNLIQTAALLSAGMTPLPGPSAGVSQTAIGRDLNHSGKGNVRVHVGDVERAPRAQHVRASGTGAQAAGRNIVNKGKK